MQSPTSPIITGQLKVQSISNAETEAGPVQGVVLRLSPEKSGESEPNGFRLEMTTSPWGSLKGLELGREYVVEIRPAS